MIGVHLKDVHAGARDGRYVRLSGRSRPEKHLHTERNEKNCYDSNDTMRAQRGTNHRKRGRSIPAHILRSRCRGLVLGAHGSPVSAVQLVTFEGFEPRGFAYDD